MNIPKPTPPKSRLVPISETVKESKPAVKQPYRRPEHLMTKPFAGLKNRLSA